MSWLTTAVDVDIRSNLNREDNRMRWQVFFRSQVLLFAITATLLPRARVLHGGEPVQPAAFRHAGITSAWKQFGDRLTFGKGQTLALVDDGCKLEMPEWTAHIDGRPKVLVTYDSVDGDDNPKHEGRGYHGSTIGVPSSLNYNGKWGVAYNNQV
ncbi:MAG: hypothetical protein ABGZ17_11380, partial [Planctomycetaceae bacterium]